MSEYKFDERVLSSEGAEFPKLLATAHSKRLRPLCMCVPSGVEMYVASIRGGFILKRMPGSGGRHSPECDSFEPPAELSGLGEVKGSAIKENVEEGVTQIKFAFSMRKMSGKTPPAPSGIEPDSVKSDGTKLSLRGTLHYLWEEAGFNRWAPAMEGKRNWGVIQRHLIAAADDKASKGGGLNDFLFVPDPFSQENKERSAKTRMARFKKISAEGKTRRLMLVIAEVKEFGTARFGFKIVFKHLPDCHFMLRKDLHERIVKRFNREIEMWGAIEESHLLAIATFGVSINGIPSIEEISLMNTSPNWIPFETAEELALLDWLTEKNRRFVKGLRYNLQPNTPLASVFLGDTPEPVAIYLKSDDKGLSAAIDDLIAQSKLQSVIWSPGDGGIPERKGGVS